MGYKSPKTMKSLFTLMLIILSGLYTMLLQNLKTDLLYIQSWQVYILGLKNVSTKNKLKLHEVWINAKQRELKLITTHCRKNIDPKRTRNV